MAIAMSILNLPLQQFGAKFLKAVGKAVVNSFMAKIENILLQNKLSVVGSDRSTAYMIKIGRHNAMAQSHKWNKFVKGHFNCQFVYLNVLPLTLIQYIR